MLINLYRVNTSISETKKISVSLRSCPAMLAPPMVHCKRASIQRSSANLLPSYSKYLSESAIFSHCHRLLGMVRVYESSPWTTLNNLLMKLQSFNSQLRSIRTILFNNIWNFRLIKNEEETING